MVHCTRAYIYRRRSTAERYGGYTELPLKRVGWRFCLLWFFCCLPWFIVTVACRFIARPCPLAALLRTTANSAKGKLRWIEHDSREKKTGTSLLYEWARDALHAHAIYSLYSVASVSVSRLCCGACAENIWCRRHLFRVQTDSLYILIFGVGTRYARD